MYEQAVLPSIDHIPTRYRRVDFPASGLIRSAMRLERALVSKVPHVKDSAASKADFCVDTQGNLVLGVRVCAAIAFLLCCKSVLQHSQSPYNDPTPALAHRSATGNESHCEHRALYLYVAAYDSMYLCAGSVYAAVELSVRRP